MLHQLTYWKMRRYTHQHVDMIRRQVPFDNRRIQFLTHLAENISGARGYFSAHDTISVLGRPNQMELQIKNCMRTLSVSGHSVIIL